MHRDEMWWLEILLNVHLKIEFHPATYVKDFLARAHLVPKCIQNMFKQKLSKLDVHERGKKFKALSREECTRNQINMGI